MRLAWFSPLPPAPTGIAGYSADILPLLDAAGYEIDRFTASTAHEFAWRRRRPYDLVVHQLGNSEWHDYMWPYLFTAPGLVVLHDARLHHARAALLFRHRRRDDYRREFAYNHPAAPDVAADYALEGLRGSPFHFWPMTRAVIDAAKLVAVHNEFVAQELRDTHPAAHVERIHLGVPPMIPSEGARDTLRRAYGIPASSVVFIAFGLVTPEKRIEPILRALGTLAARGRDVHLLVAGGNGFPGLDDLIAARQLGGRVHVTGYVAEERIADYLAAADVSLSLRWPTAGETSGAWAESLAASRPTIITSLPHTADVPALDARTWQPTRRARDPIAVAVDMLDEDATLLAAMSRLAEDAALRETLGRAAHAYWAAEHHVSLMADDYQRVIALAASLPAPAKGALPAHLTDDYSGRAMAIARELGVDLDLGT